VFLDVEKINKKKTMKEWVGSRLSEFHINLRVKVGVKVTKDDAYFTRE
jgi:hypothetical protein